MNKLTIDLTQDNPSSNYNNESIRLYHVKLLGDIPMDSLTRIWVLNEHLIRNVNRHR